MPHGVQSPRTYPYLRDELEAFKKALEGWLGKAISDEDLDRAIDVYNTNRRLLRQVYQMRQGPNPPITGA